MHGGRIGFVFQDPGTSLNPLLTLERQITESLEAHRRLTRREARARALELLDAVGLPDPETRLRSYPHQLSGGQRQRVMVAIALACDPELLVADEPTTSLDVTTQAQIIDLVRTLQRDFGTAVMWISHDLGVIGQVADDVTVLREGTVVEQAPILDVFDRPRADYTRELLAARPLVGSQRPRRPPDDAPVLLTVDGLDVRFPVVDTEWPDHRPRGQGGVLPHPPRHYPRLGRRVRLGQVDGGGGADRAGHAGCGPGVARRYRRPWSREAGPRRRCGGASAWCSRIRSRPLTPASRWGQRSANR